MRSISIWNVSLLVCALAACDREHHEGPAFEDPLHARGIRVEARTPGLPPAASPESAAQVFPVPPPPFSEGIFPCSRCHLGGEPARDEMPAMPHKKHVDREVACEDCHGTDPKVPAAESCFECHEDLASEPPAVRAYFDATRQADGSYVFPRRFRTQDVIANHAGHAKAGVACAACHGEVSDGPFRKEKSVPWMARCVACHEERKAPAKCESCHRETREPQHKDIVLDHAEEQRGCLDCHDPEDRDQLRLANGQRLPFAESYRLCGQCHGPNLRDWKAGLHGKRTGMWDGERQYFLCVHCHRNPHAPGIPPMAPEPPPARPEDIR